MQKRSSNEQSKFGIEFAINGEIRGLGF
jgi:hypothetical protein